MKVPAVKQRRIAAEDVLLRAPASVVISIRNGVSLPFCPLVSVGRVMYLQPQTGLYSREGIALVPGGAPDCE